MTIHKNTEAHQQNLLEEAQALIDVEAVFFRGLDDCPKEKHVSNWLSPRINSPVFYLNYCLYNCGFWCFNDSM